MSRRLHLVAALLAVVLAAMLLLAACEADKNDYHGYDPPGDDDAGDDDVGGEDDDGAIEPLHDRCLFYRDEDWALPDEKRADAPGLPRNRFTADAAYKINGLIARSRELINDPHVAALDRHRALQALVCGRTPQLRKGLALSQAALERDQSLSATQRGETRIALLLVLSMLDRLQRATDYAVPDLLPSPPIDHNGSLQIELNPAVIERYWKFYHWTEILGAFNNDSQYLHLLEGTGREDFIDSEIGRSNIETQMDEWRVRPEVWNDAGLSDEQRLMSAKYGMWRNPDWGGGGHYVDEYWAWEPSFVDEDSPLFTGNLLSALAAEYGATRHRRTLRRLRQMVDALLYYDELTIDGPDPLDVGPRDGRLQRGPKMKNLYYSDEPNLMTLTLDEQGIHFHHNNSVADQRTGRERKNVSRDQYYGVLTGYYTLYTVFQGLDALDADEEQLLCDVVIHMERIVDYLRGPRFNPDHGPLYNLYVLFEGSCANPPNLSFMGMMAADWLEQVSGRELIHWQAGDELMGALLDLGALIGTVELASELFEPAHSGLTALNQYLGALLMSDQPRAHWEFIFPGELLRDASQGRRNLWRRLIAAYAFKFGDTGNADYQSVVDELLSPEFNPPTTVDDLYCGTSHGYVKVRPAGWGIEDLVWPLMLLVYSADNSADLADELLIQYQSLVDQGVLSFEHTDIEPN
ncbi:MAG: hypothetical protein P9M14_07415 [Candidatus Alcyoniella australis]|nr:hypothetical protein [Candidatus Alcyoniella australis]